MNTDNRFDNKLFTLLLIRKWKTVLIFALLGAILFGVPYALSRTVIGSFNYRGEVTVHIEYAEDSAGNQMDYINYYSWQTWIGSDEFLDDMEAAGLVQKDTERSMLSAYVGSDVRLVTFTVTGKNADRVKELTNVLSGFVSSELVSIVPEVKEAKVINTEYLGKYFVYNSIPQVTVFGLIVGLIVGIIFSWIMVILDDSLYIPGLFSGETGLKELEDAEGTTELVIDKDIPDIKDVTGSVLLVINAGARNGKIIGRVIDECAHKGIEIKGFKAAGLDEKLVKAYYRPANFPGLFMRG